MNFRQFSLEGHAFWVQNLAVTALFEPAKSVTPTFKLLVHFKISPQTMQIRSKRPNISVGLYMIRPTMEVTEEELIFSGMDLVASVGGYLGLYLGASIMSLYQVGLQVMERFQ